MTLLAATQQPHDDTAWLQGAADAFAAVMTERTGKTWIGHVRPPATPKDAQTP